MKFLQHTAKTVLYISETFALLNHNNLKMATTIKTQTAGATRKQSVSVQYQEPKRLSKFALWRRENPVEQYTER